jgi:Bacterial pre-peptidase C-terminal domain/Dockerin type I domain
MLYSNMSKSSGVSRSKKQDPRRRTGERRRLLELELLETRNLLATWTPLTHLAPDGAGEMMLLTDGRVMMQGAATSKAWYALTPSSAGSYISGTWSTLAPMGLERLYFGSNVLPNGNVFLVGGEYSGPSGAQNFTNTGETYDSTANTWAPTATFPLANFGDDPTVLLANGSILAGNISGPETYFYNPTTNAWSQAGTKLRGDASDEETWVKLPDGSILSYDIFASISTGVSTAQRYIPSQNTWVDAGTITDGSGQPLFLSSPSIGYELGPALLLPDGRVFQIGGTGATALYTPSTNSWSAGPSIPNAFIAADAPAAILPNGHVVLAAAPFGTDGSGNFDFPPPTELYDFDPIANTISQLSLPAALTSALNGIPSYLTRMLMLPSGDLLLGTSSNQLWEYTPDGGPSASWTPTISSTVLNPDGSYTLTGTQLNGLSEGSSYGDDAESSSNYPIVQLTSSSGAVTYARTFNWTSQVATGSTPVTTQFSFASVPAPGVYSLRAIANGIASTPVNLTVALTVTSSTPANGAIVSAAPTSFAVSFNEALLPGSVQPGDLLVNGIAATGVTLNGSNTTATFTFNTTPVTVQGLQNIAIAANGVTGVDNSGNLGFSSSFRYDALTLAVSSTGPAVGSTITIPPNSFNYDVTFNEPIDPATAATSNLTLSQGTVSAFTVLPGNQTVRYTLTGITTEGTLSVSLATGKVKDAFDNPGFTTFAGTYTLDYGITPFPTPLTSVQPLGSLVYSGSIPGRINTVGDTDNFTLNLNAGQTITVVMHPTDPALQPTISLEDPANTLLGTMTAGAANQDALLETVATTTGGIYTITAGAGGATTGGYTIQVYLNAADELERHPGQANNNTIAGAQNIDSSFEALTSSPLTTARAAVSGTTDNTIPYTAAAVTPAFTSISTTGHRSVNAVGDDAADTLTAAQLAGFTFPFIGTTYSSVSFSTNGLISFGVADAEFANTDLSNSPPEAVIAPFWDDMVIDGTGTGTASRGIFWQVIGSGASQQLIIQWNNEHEFGATTTFTFEAVLSVNGTIQFNYANSLPTAAVLHATIGVKAPGTNNPTRLLISFDQAAGSLVGPGLSTRLNIAPFTADFYAFTLNAGDSATLALSGLTSPFVTLELDNASGISLAQGGASTTNASQLINDFVAPSTGTYYVRVFGIGAFDYNLVIDRNAEFGKENGFTPLTSNLYHLGIAGTIASTTDTDYFNIGTLQAGDIITVSESGVDSSRGTLGDPIVELYRAGATSVVTSSDDDGPGADSLIYRFTITTTDTYFVHATSFQGDTGSYSLGIFLENTAAAPATGGTLVSETEPNDSIATANDASTSWRPVQDLAQSSGNLALGGGSYYQYQFTAGDLVTVNIHSTSSLDARVSLLDATGAPIGSEDGTSTGPGNDSEIYALRIPTTGTYYVLVQGNNSAGTFISNVYLSTAQPFGTQVLGSLPVLGYVDSGDLDLYQITLANNVSLLAQTTTPGDGGGQFVNTLDPRLRLFNSLGTLVASDDNSAPDGRNARLNYTVPAGQGGTYFVEVSSSTAGSATTGEYVLGTSTTTDSATHFSVSGPTSIGAGAPTTITVTALDSTNNTFPGYVGTVHFTSSDLIAGLPGDYPFVAGDAGVHTFSVTLNTTGNQTVTATDVGNMSIAGVSNTITVVAPIVVQGTQVNDGSAQRSMVQSLTVSFNHAVTLDAGAFTIVLHANSTINGQTGQTAGTVPVLGWTTSDGGLTYVITFSGAGVLNNSIADGLYDLRLDHTKTHDATSQTLATDYLFSFYRLFGDFNGDGTVNNADSFQFSRAFNKSTGQSGYLAFFDFNGDGTINNSDSFQFNKRFNTTYKL